jgi:hypothetical protein
MEAHETPDPPDVRLFGAPGVVLRAESRAHHRQQTRTWTARRYLQLLLRLRCEARAVRFLKEFQGRFASDTKVVSKTATGMHEACRRNFSAMLRILWPFIVHESG